MKYRAVSSFVLVAAILAASGAGAQTAVKAAGTRVNVYQYAVDNPVEDSAMRIAPTLGASVPASIKLTPCEDEKTYAYFYYNGHPVIVDRSTRSVVRIGQ